MALSTTFLSSLWMNFSVPIGVPRATVPSFEKGMSLGRLASRTWISDNSGEKHFPLSFLRLPSMCWLYKIFHLLYALDAEIPFPMIQRSSQYAMIRQSWNSRCSWTRILCMASEKVKDPKVHPCLLPTELMISVGSLGFSCRRIDVGDS